MVRCFTWLPNVVIRWVRSYRSGIISWPPPLIGAPILRKKIPLCLARAYTFYYGPWRWTSQYCSFSNCFRTSDKQMWTFDSKNTCPGRIRSSDHHFDTFDTLPTVLLSTIVENKNISGFLGTARIMNRIFRAVPYRIRTVSPTYDFNYAPQTHFSIEAFGRRSTVGSYIRTYFVRRVTDRRVTIALERLSSQTQRRQTHVLQCHWMQIQNWAADACETARLEM